MGVSVVPALTLRRGPLAGARVGPDGPGAGVEEGTPGVPLGSASGRVAKGGIRRSDVALRGGDDLSHGRRGGATGSGARAGRICGGLPWMATAGATSGESAGGDTGQQASWGLNLHHPRLAGWLYHVFDAHSLRQYE